MTRIQPVRSIAPFNSYLGGVAGKHAFRLNAVTTEVMSARDGTTFFPLEAVVFAPGRPFGSTDTYRQRALTLMNQLVPALQQVRDEERGRER